MAAGDKNPLKCSYCGKKPAKGERGMKRHWRKECMQANKELFCKRCKFLVQIKDMECFAITSGCEKHIL